MRLEYEVSILASSSLSMSITLFCSYESRMSPNSAIDISNESLSPLLHSDDGLVKSSLSIAIANWICPLCPVVIFFGFGCFLGLMPSWAFAPMASLKLMMLSSRTANALYVGSLYLSTSSTPAASSSLSLFSRSAEIFLSNLFNLSKSPLEATVSNSFFKPSVS